MIIFTVKLEILMKHQRILGRNDFNKYFTKNTEIYIKN